MIQNAAVKAYPDDPQKYYDFVASLLPIGRMGEPYEIGNLVCFLASDQAPFLTGAAISRGGKSFLCLRSSFVNKNGEKISSIRPRFTGDIITDPRSETFLLVTEYGVINLVGRTTWERAELIISIAHPDFRDELIRDAEKQGIWRQSNKR